MTRDTNRLTAGLRAAGLALAAVLLIAACGSSSSSSSSSAAASGAGAASGTSSAAAGSGRTYIVATSADFPPFSSRSASNPNVIVGFEPDMIKAVMAHLGWRYRWVTSDFNGLIPAVQSGRVDMVVSDVYDTPSREKVVDFIDYLKTGLSVMVARSNASKVHSFMDICGHSMGILTGASSELQFAQQESKACTSAGKPAIDIHSFPAVAQEVPALENGNLYAMFEDTITEHLISTSQHGAVKVVFSDPAATTLLGIVLRKGSPIESRLRAAVQWYLGTPQYRENAAHWGLPASSLITKA
ncbi:MAG TPA: ABC transporter substrate-binding protein [Solirubrobacteraceae bacterium]|nr:ABC transporter substrate-binding protein [Solirubrobacteraceae bacterium]